MVVIIYSGCDLVLEQPWLIRPFTPAGDISITGPFLTFLLPRSIRAKFAPSALGWLVLWRAFKLENLVIRIRETGNWMRLLVVDF